MIAGITAGRSRRRRHGDFALLPIADRAPCRLAGLRPIAAPLYFAEFPRSFEGDGTAFHFGADITFRRTTSLSFARLFEVKFRVHLLSCRFRLMMASNIDYRG